MPRVQSVVVDPLTLYWLRTHLAEYLKSGVANGHAHRAQRALTTVREICDHYIDGKNDDVRLALVVKERG